MGHGAAGFGVVSGGFQSFFGIVVLGYASIPI